MQNGLIYLAKNEGVKTIENQIWIEYNLSNNSPKYSHAINMKKHRDLDFNDILFAKDKGRGIDMLGRKGIANTFISGSLKRIAKLHDTFPEHILVVIYAKTDDAKPIYMKAYDKSKNNALLKVPDGNGGVKNIDLDWILS